jgi:uncharacterized protein
MLRVDLRALEDGPVSVSSTVPADDQLFADTDLRLAAPVVVEGILTAAGPGRYFWRGRLGASVRFECRRCLVETVPALDVPVDVLFMERGDVEEDETDVYVIPENARVLELQGMVREELVLAIPDGVLCRADCQGLCDQCGNDVNEGPCECARPVDPRWAALEALRSNPGSEEA